MGSTKPSPRGRGAPRPSDGGGGTPGQAQRGKAAAAAPDGDKAFSKRLALSRSFVAAPSD